MGESDADELLLESWSDADFANDKKDRKSVTSGVITTNGAIIQWISKKQTSVSLFAMEAEVTSPSHVGRELLGLRELLREIEFMVSQPMTMKMDNQAYIKQLESEDSMKSAKHVDIRVQFIRDFAKRGIITPSYVESRIMMADLLHKALPAPRMMESREFFWFR